MPTSSPLPSDTTTATATTVPSITQIASHPVPLVIDPLGLLSGYFVDESDYSDVAVLVIRSFDGRKLDDYLEAWKDPLNNFLG